MKSARISIRLTEKSGRRRRLDRVKTVKLVRTGTSIIRTLVSTTSTANVRRRSCLQSRRAASKYRALKKPPFTETDNVNN